jgi:hypothetical protein
MYILTYLYIQIINELIIFLVIDGKINIEVVCIFWKL